MIDETQTAEKLAAPAKPWEFRSKKAYQRLLIMAGGVMVNFILALVIYSAVFYTWGDKYYAVEDMTMGMKFNDEAKALGFQDHDILLRSDLGEFKDFSADLLRDISKAHEVIVLRNGRECLVPLNGDLNLLNMLKADPMFCRPFVPALVDSIIPKAHRRRRHAHRAPAQGAAEADGEGSALRAAVLRRQGRNPQG